MDCLFCKIVAGSIPARRIFEDDQVLVFPDITPQAPVHLLIIPKKHIASLAGLAGRSVPGDPSASEEKAVLGQMLAAAAEIAEKQGLQKGYRIVINTGEDGGQSVDHLHLHLLGGRAMHWPPG